MKLITGLIIFFFFIIGVAFSAVTEELWQSKKSTHFTVYYKTEAARDYVDELLRFAEKYYETITEELGFRRFEFWTWDKKCKIHLYSSLEEYQEAANQPRWSGAAAYPKERLIITFLGKPDFFETILPHEMAHLIFREFVGYKTDLPLWLDEGIACLQEKSNRELYLRIAKILVKTSVFIPLEKLTEIRREGLVMQDVFYAESASVVQFLLKEYGNEKFVDYCRKLRDNRNWKVSLIEVYGFKNLSEMNEKWIDFLLR